MDTKAIEKFSVEARRQLLRDVEQRLYAYGLDDAGRAEFGPESDIVRGTVLDASEKGQRVELYRRIEDEGSRLFVEEMAYTWFNRLVAIRYMELHDFLSNRVRMLSAADGSFDPECIRVASTLDLPGLEHSEVVRLIQSGDDESLYRAILVAQCNELAVSLPTVFGRVSADALTLPGNLLRKSETNVLYRLVTDIPERSWRRVEILGWLYQFYNSEVKAEFLKSKRKATEADLAPATQLFTPEWIVRYMVDNSLGRLWMLNHPESKLRDLAKLEDPDERLMEYYIEPNDEHEDFVRVASPEDITLCDPACGSGHILVYAFRMLVAIYEECGYRRREIPQLILTKNLSGFEIDPRAAQIASMALAFCAREYDRRFFDRGVTADVRVLCDVKIDRSVLSPKGRLCKRSDLLDSLEHLGEVGSLLRPTPEDIAALEAELSNASGGLLEAKARTDLQYALETCKALARSFDVAVANPPYMGSGKFNAYLSKWMKKHYPDEKSDLCTAFIKKLLNMIAVNGYAGVTGTNSWMFLASFEELRKELINNRTILTLVQLSVHGFKGVAAQICTGVIAQSYTHGFKGAYIRLNDFDHHTLQEPKTLEAIHNQDCGWFYRADASTFHDVPGSPIAYWASKATHAAFLYGKPLRGACAIHSGVRTGCNDMFLRFWWEISNGSMSLTSYSTLEAKTSGKKWFPCNKGGGFRRWFGNNINVINWKNDGFDIRNHPGSDISPTRPFDWPFQGGLTWGTISSSLFSMRVAPKGSMFETKGAACLPVSYKQSIYILGLTNTSIVNHLQSILSPTLDYHEGPFGKLPLIANDLYETEIEKSVTECVSISRYDWNAQEISYDFKRNPLV